MNALTITRSLSLAGLLFAFGPALAETTAVAEQQPESTVLCTRDRTEQLRALSPEDQGSALRDEIRNFQEFAEETLSTRAAAIDLYHELRGKLDKNKPLSGDDLMRLNHGATAMLAQREALQAQRALARQAYVQVGVGVHGAVDLWLCRRRLSLHQDFANGRFEINSEGIPVFIDRRGYADVLA